MSFLFDECDVATRLTHEKQGFKSRDFSAQALRMPGSPAAQFDVTQPAMLEFQGLADLFAGNVFG